MTLANTPVTEVTGVFAPRPLASPAPPSVHATAAARVRHVLRIEKLLVLLHAVRLQIVTYLDRWATAATGDVHALQSVNRPDDDVRLVGVEVDFCHVAFGPVVAL